MAALLLVFDVLLLQQVRYKQENFTYLSWTMSNDLSLYVYASFIENLFKVFLHIYF